MASRQVGVDRPRTAFERWMLAGYIKEPEGPFESSQEPRQHVWWRVMCLTGVDYFSTLGYQPGIAALAAGALSPIATMVLVLLTLFGALPIYWRVAEESPRGEGSIAMLERLLPSWYGKLFVLVLLGFVATDFIITITLSAADATAHIVENPFSPGLARAHAVGVTLSLVAVLGGVFLKGFKEAIGLAVVLVGAYLALNTVVILVALEHLLGRPDLIHAWLVALHTAHPSVVGMAAAALLVFPKLALGLSGFETGVAVMPLVKGAPGDTEANPAGRIRNTRRLLVVAALIMSVFLVASSLVTTVLIPAEAFRAATPLHEAGKANGRALAYLAHAMLGEGFGTVYDISTIFILWFAGASAMAGLLNIVPRYLPRYGMAPDWTRAVRPLVLVYAAIAFGVTILFRADVDAQGGAYATGVLVLITSGAAAVSISSWRRSRAQGIGFAAITLVFVYTTVVNIIERPDGIKIAAFFITVIIFTSLVSRIRRTTELRVDHIELDPEAERIVSSLGKTEIHVIANKRQKGDKTEYRLKEREQRLDNRIPPEAPVIFLEVEVADASEFRDVMKVVGVEKHGYRILRARGASVPNSIAAFLLYLRDRTGQIPHAYFSWSEGNPFRFLLSYIAFGEGDTAPVTHEVLRRTEEDPERRPALHVG